MYRLNAKTLVGTEKGARAREEFDASRSRDEVYCTPFRRTFSGSAVRIAFRGARNLYFLRPSPKRTPFACASLPQMS